MSFDTLPLAAALQLSDPIAATRLSWLQFPAGWNDAAHPSPRRQLFVVLAGEVEGWTSKGDRRHFRPGDCLLMEDTVGKGHGAKPLNSEALAIMVRIVLNAEQVTGASGAQAWGCCWARHLAN